MSSIHDWYRMHQFNVNEALGDTVMEKYESLYVKLFDLFDQLDGPGHVICGSELGSMFETARSKFDPQPSPEGVQLSDLGFARLGRVNDRFDVYVDKTLKNMMYVCGKSGVVRLNVKDFVSR